MISLETLQRERASSRDDGGFSRVVAGLSSYDRELREPLMLAREVQSPFKLRVGAWNYSRVTAGEVGLKTC